MGSRPTRRAIAFEGRPARRSRSTSCASRRRPERAGGGASPGASPSGSAPPAATPEPRELLDEFDVTIVRAKIQRREVTSRELAGGTVGYVSLAGFSGEGAKQLEDAIRAHLDNGIKKIVFDLRGNPGGFVTDAEAVASEFLANGPIYFQEEADGTQKEVLASPGGIATDPSIEVVLLIDRGSASASEIVAGALQDRGRATLVGETTFGKGTVQQWLELGKLGGVKLTVSKWLTPDKHWIHRVGISPDIAVTMPADNPPGSRPRARAGAGGARRVGSSPRGVPPGRLTPRQDVSCTERRVRLRFPRTKGGDVQCQNTVAAPPRRRWPSSRSAPRGWSAATGRRSFGTGVRAFI